jgi:hypothetical protein
VVYLDRARVPRRPCQLLVFVVTVRRVVAAAPARPPSLQRLEGPARLDPDGRHEQVAAPQEAMAPWSSAQDDPGKCSEHTSDRSSKNDRPQLTTSRKLQSLLKYTWIQLSSMQASMKFQHSTTKLMRTANTPNPRLMEKLRSVICDSMLSWYPTQLPLDQLSDPLDVVEAEDDDDDCCSHWYRPIPTWQGACGSWLDPSSVRPVMSGRKASSKHPEVDDDAWAADAAASYVNFKNRHDMAP